MLDMLGRGENTAQARIMPDKTATRRKRLLYRSWHRGTHELDLILGRFADAHMDALTVAQLDAYETLLGIADPDLYNWVSGREPIPPIHDNDVIRLIISSNNPK